MNKNQIFQFKRFSVDQSDCLMKVGTDGILLGAWCDTKDSDLVLDIGCGTGLIALMIAQRTEDSNIHAVEIDKATCLQARQNFDQSVWSDRLTAHHVSIQKFYKERESDYDLIVCNPPFFSGGTLSNNPDRNAVRHTVKLSHADLLRAVRHLLNPTGRFCVVLPNIEGLRFVEIARTYGFYLTKKTTVKSKESKPVERLLLEFSKSAKKTAEDIIIIYNDDNSDWHESYKSLTRDFFLD